MNKFLLLLVLCFLCFCLNAQTPVANGAQPYGKVDTADLKLTACDFEKGAGAMVLFDKTEVVTEAYKTVIVEHKRIKILNSSGMDEANITIEYISKSGIEKISELQAETINFDKNGIDITVVDPEQIYKQTENKLIKKISFSFPNVRVGSIIEYNYKTTIDAQGAVPSWNFQGNLPVRYCELKAFIRNELHYEITPHVNGDYEKNEREIWLKKKGDTIGETYTWALKNVNSYMNEPFSTCRKDGILQIIFRLSAIRPRYDAAMHPLGWPWWLIVTDLLDNEDFGRQLTVKLADDTLTNKAKLLTTVDDKIAYIFNRVKNRLKWNSVNELYTSEGVKKAWEKKSGNSTEINLALYHFLTEAKIECYPMLVSTRENGKVNTNYSSLSQFNKTVIGVFVGDKKSYILDASNKFNTYTDTPFNILNATALLVNPIKRIYQLIYLKNERPSAKIVYVSAQINSGLKLQGTAEIKSFDNIKTESLRMYERLGEKKYIDVIKNNDNNTSITLFKRENIENDTLSLLEQFNFKSELTASDNDYIYFSPNLFTLFNTNPFLSEKRQANIDYGYLANYSINGLYKPPAGYKIEAVPKNIFMVMPDKSIVFRRVAEVQNGKIIVHDTINFKKSIFTPDEYPSLRDFYKKMFEMLNEQIVLKKI